MGGVSVGTSSRQQEAAVRERGSRWVRGGGGRGPRTGATMRSLQAANRPELVPPMPRLTSTWSLQPPQREQQCSVVRSTRRCCCGGAVMQHPKYQHPIPANAIGLPWGCSAGSPHLCGKLWVMNSKKRWG